MKLDRDNMTMAELIEQQAKLMNYKTIEEILRELGLTHDAKNELYMLLAQTQKELRETQMQFNHYVQNTIDLATKLECVPGGNIWHSIEQRFTEVQNGKYLLGNLLVLPPAGPETGKTQTQESD